MFRDLVGDLKILIQCDFDGTITEEDTAFFLLDLFAQGDWRQLLRQYREHRISVGEFNARAFALVKADRETLLGAIKGRVRVRRGFRQLVDYCRGRGLRLVIVSNGLDFYIEAVLEELGMRDIEVHAARTDFSPEGLKVQYLGPEGGPLQDAFKEAYVRWFLGLGYRVIYIGDGDSDIPPVKRADFVFARGELLSYCRKNSLNYRAFEDFFDVIGELELLHQRGWNFCHCDRT